MSKTLAPPVTARDPKGLKFISIVEAAYNKAGLSEKEAQRVNEASGLAELVGNFIAENRRVGQFADEEVASNYGYLLGYKPNPTLEENLRDLVLELKALRTSFPELANSDYDREFVERIRKGEIKLPMGAERWTLIPRQEKLASTYGKAMEKVLAMIAKARNGKFTNYREGQLGEEYLRHHAKTAEMLQKLGDEQFGDILVVPCQFGLRHRGKSVRRAREVFTANEFGLGAFAVGIMLLTHPERLQHNDDLWVDCAGDEFSPDADGQFSDAPYFTFDDVRLRFGTFFVGPASAVPAAAAALRRPSARSVY